MGNWVIVPVSADLMQEFFTNGVKPAVEIRAGLPPGAEFDGAWYDFATNRFLIRYRHESFKATMPGDAIPHLHPTAWKVEADADAPAVVPAS